MVVHAKCAHERSQSGVVDAGHRDLEGQRFAALEK